MTDRSVEHPNRYQLAPVSGTTDTFDFEAVPGTVTAPGTDLNKANLLSDATAALIHTLYGSTPSTPNEALSYITNKTQALWSNRVQLAAGSYIGTGTYGSSHPTVINCCFTPQILFLFTDNSTLGSGYWGSDGGIIINPSSYWYTMNSSNPCSVTWTSSGVSFYCASGGSAASYQYNQSGTTYYYKIIG